MGGGVWHRPYSQGLRKKRKKKFLLKTQERVLVRGREKRN
jgi:hypothetical protein